ncbi:hypothetical protein [Sphingobium chungbukense]|uniref:Uncharacterized protein n=1 Tax=Sphingobium chungbukense TaxID=56193 RepID=A0A0M3AV75_9SPHN|nr:hypothetical protein [Sphingobium chungbukense]KKW93818.1 hypothetical protein YP76_03915 [Sphingobium chungbukense]
MTWTGQRLLAAVGLVGTLALGGCGYDDGYYGGVSVGTGYYGGGYYDDYWGSGYYRPGYYSGWYDGFYYPGSGYYVYDRGGSRHRWNEGQRRYWEGRREARRDGGRRDTWNGGGSRPSWRDRPDGDGNRWNRDWGATRPNAQSQSGRGRQDMTTPRTWNRDTSPRARSDGGGRSRRDGWRSRRD